MNEKLIFLDVDVDDKLGLFKFVSNNLFELEYISSQRMFLKDLCKREKISSTYIGEGVSIPHTQSRYVLENCVCFVRTLKKVKSSYDGDLSDLFIFIVIKKDNNTSDNHLEFLSKIARKLVNKENIKELRSAKSVVNIIEIMDI